MLFNLTHTMFNLKPGTTIGELYSSDWLVVMSVGMSCGTIYLINGWHGRAQPMVSNAISGQMVTIETWESNGNKTGKPHPSLVYISVSASRFPAVNSCLVFPQWWPVTCKPNNPFLPKLIRQRVAQETHADSAVINPAMIFGRFAKRFWSFKLKEPFECSEPNELLWQPAKWPQEQHRQ